jgi:hypothetical protein
MPRIAMQLFDLLGIKGHQLGGSEGAALAGSDD